MALLRVFTGYRSSTHNLSCLLALIKIFFYFICYNIIAANISMLFNGLFGKDSLIAEIQKKVLPNLLTGGL